MKQHSRAGVAWLFACLAIATVTATTTVSECSTLADLYSSTDDIAWANVLVVVSDKSQNDEKCDQTVAQHILNGAKAFGEFVQVKCVSRHSSSPELLRALNIQDSTAAVFIKQGLVLSDPLNYQAISTTAAPAAFQDWFSAAMRVSVTVRSDRNEQLNVYWLNGVDEHLSKTLAPFESFAMETFPTHAFVVRSSDGAIIKTFSISGPAEIVIASDTCSSDDPACTQTDAHIKKLRDKQHTVRLTQNAKQPNIVPKFTEDGFKMTRLPGALYQRLLSYWRRNHTLKVREAWRVDDIHTNHWEADLFMLHLPAELKDAVFATMKPILEEWSGVNELIGTSCYGIREYGNGSVLEEHVDRVETHAISAILNIDQEITEPWALTMLDHHGVLHEVFMEPGDVVYYESARCLHGRPTPFNGRSYANVFVHYKPAQGWKFKQGVY